MNLQKVINSKFSLNTAVWLGKVCTQKTGYKLASFLGGIYGSCKDMNQVSALRTNLWVATGKKLNARELDKLVKSTFQCSGKCLLIFIIFTEILKKFSAT